MINKLLILCSIFCTGTCSAELAAAQTGVSSTLIITVAGVRGSTGKVMLAIYDEAAEFDSGGKSVAWFSVPADTKFVTLSDFPEGKFAISAFHDENENNDLDLDSGTPVEGYGSSGDLGKWDNPTFNKAAFEGRTANVKIHYLN